MGGRSGSARDLTWRIEAVGFDLASALLRLMPVDLVSDLGAALFKALGPLTGSHRVAERNMRLAFPQMDDEARAELLRAQWDNLGRTFFEMPLSHRLTVESGRVEVVGGERLVEIAQDRRATVFISGHFANWEVMAIVLVRAGVNCQVTYRAANNPYVDERIKAVRARYGVRLFAPKGEEGARKLLTALTQGESVALMNDQKFNDGVASTFFGRTVHTATGPTHLARKFGASLQPLSVQRVKGAHFRVVVHDPIPVERTGDRRGDIERGVDRVNAFVEARVRERPAEWFWVHKRWPAADYAALAEEGF